MFLSFCSSDKRCRSFTKTGRMGSCRNRGIFWHAKETAGYLPRILFDDLNLGTVSVAMKQGHMAVSRCHERRTECMQQARGPCLVWGWCSLFVMAPLDAAGGFPCLGTTLPPPPPLQPPRPIAAGDLPDLALDVNLTCFVLSPQLQHRTMGCVSPVNH